MKNFGEFYNNQVESAGAIILSRTDSIKEQKLEETMKLLKREESECDHCYNAMGSAGWKEIIIYDGRCGNPCKRSAR